MESVTVRVVVALVALGVVGSAAAVGPAVAAGSAATPGAATLADTGPAAQAGAPPAAAQEDTVTLTVGVETTSGDSVAGADLEATWDGGSRSATTASNGRAFLDVPRGVNVSIAVSHREYVRNRPVDVRNATERDLTVDVYPPGTLRVDVGDGTGPVADARVIVRKGGRIVASGRTDGDGTVASGDVERGEYSVDVVKRGYYRNVSRLTVDGEVRHRVSIRQGSASLRVRAVDPHFTPPRPVPEAVVRIDGVGEFRTLDAGTQTVDVPVNADLAVAVTKTGYETNETTVSVAETDASVNRSISRTPVVNLTTVNRRVVTGERVVLTTLDEYGDPIEGARISLDGETTVSTDASGQAALRIDSAGNHTLRAAANDRTSEPVTVTAVDPDANESTASPSPTPTATATTTPTPTPTTSDTGIPGFTLALTLVALLAAALVAARRS